MQQQRLCLDARERFARIRSAAFPLSPQRTHNLRQLLEKIEAHAARGDRFSVEFLADVTDRSPRTVRRTVADGEDLGVLDVWRDPRQKGGQHANRYAIDWDGLARYLPRGQSGSAGGHTGSAVGHTGRAVGQLGSAGCQTGSAFNETVPLVCPSKSPSTTTQDGWGEVVDEMRSLGVSRAAEAVEQARARGVALEEVTAIVGHYGHKIGAWGPGALFERIRNARPGEQPDQHWPPPAKAFTDLIVDQRRREQLKADHAKQEQSRRERAEFQEREARWGARIDAMSKGEIEKLLAYQVSLLGLFKRVGRESPMVREFLFECFENEQQPATA